MAHRRVAAWRIKDLKSNNQRSFKLMYDNLHYSYHTGKGINIRFLYALYDVGTFFT